MRGSAHHRIVGCGWEADGGCWLCSPHTLPEGTSTMGKPAVNIGKVGIWYGGIDALPTPKAR
ncbi:MAG: hypothetical protein ACKORY_03815, partial [Actinomycetota bacterium]